MKVPNSFIRDCGLEEFSCPGCNSPFKKKNINGLGFNKSGEKNSSNLYMSYFCHSCESLFFIDLFQLDFKNIAKFLQKEIISPFCKKVQKNEKNPFNPDKKGESKITEEEVTYVKSILDSSDSFVDFLDSIGIDADEELKDFKENES